MVYAPSLKGSFVWEDDIFITNWSLLHSSPHYTDFLKGAFPAEYPPVYRPVRSVLHYFTYTIYGDNPLGYHVQGIILHMLGALGVLYLTRRLDLPQLWRYLATLLFALHPLITENISLATGTFDLVGYVAAIWVVCALSFSTKTHKTIKVSFYILAVLLSVVAYGTSEHLYILPLLVCGWLYTVKLPWSRSLLLLLPLVLFLILRLYLGIQLMFPEIWRLDIGYRVLLSIELLGLYTWLTIWPYYLSIVHPLTDSHSTLTPVVEIITTFPRLTVLQVLGHGMVFTSVLLLLHRPIRPMGLLFLLAMASLFFASPVIPLTTFFAERFSYVFLVFISLTIGLIAYKCTIFMSNSKYARLIVIGLFLLLIASFGIRSTIRNLDYVSRNRYWDSALRAAPNESRLYTLIAIVHAQNKEYPLALNLLDKAKTKFPANGDIHFASSRTHLLAGNIAHALDEAEAAVNLSPTNQLYINHTLQLYQLSGNASHAAILLTDLTAQQPDNAYLWYIRANYHIRTNNPTDAEQAYTKALSLNPTFIEAATNLAALYNSQQRYEDTIALLESLHETTEPGQDYYYNLFVALKNNNQQDAAEKLRLEALEKFPESTSFKAIE